MRVCIYNTHTHTRAARCLLSTYKDTSSHTRSILTHTRSLLTHTSPLLTPLLPRLLSSCLLFTFSPGFTPFPLPFLPSSLSSSVPALLPSSSPHPSVPLVTQRSGRKIGAAKKNSSSWDIDTMHCKGRASAGLCPIYMYTHKHMHTHTHVPQVSQTLSPTSSCTHYQISVIGLVQLTIGLVQLTTTNSTLPFKYETI
jgi:hypothetical protein